MLSRGDVSLRAVEKGDIRQFHRWENDMEYVLAGGGDPPTPVTLEQMEAQVTSDSPKLSFTIEIGGVIAGRCGLFKSDRVGGTIMLGIGIGEKNLRGKGHGRVAIDLLLELAFRYHNFRKVWLQVWGDNTRAIRCYQACGFVEEGRLRAHVWGDGHYQDLVTMGILRDDWDSARQG